MKQLLGLLTALTLFLCFSAQADELQDIQISSELIDAYAAKIQAQQVNKANEIDEDSSTAGKANRPSQKKASPTIVVSLSPTFYLPSVEGSTTRPGGFAGIGDLVVNYGATVSQRFETLEAGGEMSAEINWDPIFTYMQYSHTEFPIDGEMSTPIGIFPVDITIGSDQFEVWVGVRQDVSENLRADVFLGYRMIRTSIDSESVLGSEKTDNDLDEFLRGTRLTYALNAAWSMFATYTQSNHTEEQRYGANYKTKGLGDFSLSYRIFELGARFDVGDSFDHSKYTLEGPVLEWTVPLNRGN